MNEVFNFVIFWSWKLRKNQGTNLYCTVLDYIVHAVVLSSVFKHYHHNTHNQRSLNINLSTCNTLYTYPSFHWKTEYMMENPHHTMQVKRGLNIWQYQMRAMSQLISKVTWKGCSGILYIFKALIPYFHTILCTFFQKWLMISVFITHKWTLHRCNSSF